MSSSLVPASNTIFDAAIVACKSSMLACNFRFFDRTVSVSSGEKRRYLKVTWDQVEKTEDNEKIFNLAKTIFWEHMSGYMYMTVVSQDSFAIAIREVMYQNEYDPGF